MPRRRRQETVALGLNNDRNLSVRFPTAPSKPRVCSPYSKNRAERPRDSPPEKAGAPGWMLPGLSEHSCGGNMLIGLGYGAAFQSRSKPSTFPSRWPG